MWFTPRFAIIGIRADGTELELFRWTRDAASGIERAKAEALRIWGTAFDRFEARPLA